MAKNSKIQKTRSIILFTIFFCSVACGLLAEASDTLSSSTTSLDYLKTKESVTEEITEQNVVKKVLHNLDEKKDFNFLLIFIIIIFVIMLFLPFFPAIRELYQKKDDKPLFVSMDYTKDPRFFDNSFREKLVANVDQVGIDRCFRITISGKEELIEVVEAKNIDNFNFGKYALYLDGDLHMKKGMNFSKEVYVNGTTELQENTKIRALLSEKDLILGKDCKVIRWIGSEENIFVGSGCNLGVRCTCEKELHIEENCVFKSLYGHPIITDYSVQNKCYNDVTLKENVEIDADIISDKNIILGSNCRVWGNLFCQGEITIAPGCEIGTEGIVKSVIGKKGITLEGNVKIHGYVLTEGKGITA